MAENIQEYGIEIGFEDALKKLSKLRSANKRMNSMQEQSLKRQINLQSRLNFLKKAGIKVDGGMGGGRMPISHKIPIPKQPSQPSMPKSKVPKDDFDIVQAALEKRLKEEGATAAKLANTENQKIAEAANKQLNLQRAKNKALNNESVFHRMNLTAQEKIARESLRTAINNAKNVDEVRKAKVAYRASLADNKALTKNLQKQSYILQRMQSSSKQFAGNMISAFAIAAGAAGIVRIGQDFEAVNNTMLAVSENSKAAGNNFKFVRDEAFRLGLGLKESAKGFAKLVAARGDMSIEDTKAAFTGISEMSTLLGLSAEESSRAINALQQMASKGVVSAKTLAL